MLERSFLRISFAELVRGDHHFTWVARSRRTTLLHCEVSREPLSCYRPSCFTLVLQEEVRDILAATGKSGGISAEQILRQFNAKRFAEASKVWAAAEGFMSTDPLYFTSPGKPYTPSAPPYPAPAPPSTFDATSCTIGGSSPCNVDVGDAMDYETAGGARAFHARGGGASSGGSTLDGKARTMRVRSCGGGGWVC